MTTQDFANWCNSQVGQHEDFDGVYGTQCVDFFNFAYRYLTGQNFIHQFGGMPGAKDVWNVNAPGFTKVVNNPNDPNQLPPQGSIIFWSGNMPGSGGYGHVAIVDHADANNIVVWEEIPGSDVRHLARRWSTPYQHWELGWWIFNGFTVPTPPAPPVPPAPPAPVITLPYHIEPITPKDVVINKDTHRWGMNYDNLTAMEASPEGNVSKGNVKTVTALCHHNIGYSYYLEDPNVASGYNVVDCDDIPAPAPIPVTPPQPPAAPLTIPNSLDPYLVVKDIPGYLSPGQAILHAKPNSTVAANTYMIYNRQNSMINVTLVAGKPGWWINPLDNVITPPSTTPSNYLGPRESSAPATVDVNTWKSSYRAFVNRSGERTPVKYVALENYVVKDIATQKPDRPIHQYDYVIVGGTFEKDGVIYGRPQQAAANFLWYGIPLDEGIIEPYAQLYSSQTSTAERQELHQMTLYDYIVVGYENVANMFSSIGNIFKKGK